MKKSSEAEIKSLIESILENESRGMSIREITAELSKKGIKRSPQVILKYLEVLEKEGKIGEQLKNRNLKIIGISSMTIFILLFLLYLYLTITSYFQLAPYYQRWCIFGTCHL